MYILGSVLAFSALSFCVGQENNSQLVETAPSIKTCRVTTSPVIDGNLTDDCWREAEAATDFWRSNGLSRIESSASVQLAYDDENLFVGFRCPLSNPQSVTAAQTGSEVQETASGVPGSTVGSPARCWSCRRPGRSVLHASRPKDIPICGQPR